MELTKQVVSLDLAKRLKKLGVKQESLFWWSDELIEIDTHERRFHVTMFPASFETRPDGVRYATERYAAFTVAELGEICPDYIGDILDCSFFSSQHVGSYWEVGYSEMKKSFEAETQADARAKMLIYLLENKLLPENNK